MPSYRIAALEIAKRVGLLNGPAVVPGCGPQAIKTIRALTEERYLNCWPYWIIVPDNVTYDPAQFPKQLKPIQLEGDLLRTFFRLGNPLVVIALEHEHWDAMSVDLLSL